MGICVFLMFVCSLLTRNDSFEYSSHDTDDDGDDESYSDDINGTLLTVSDDVPVGPLYADYSTSVASDR